MCGCQQLVHGAIGLGKVAAQAAGAKLDAADALIIAARRDLCRACDEATRTPSPKYAANKGLTTRSQCRKCSCFIAAKTRIASEACPLGKW
jgi:hypothetical protein